MIIYLCVIVSVSLYYKSPTHHGGLLLYKYIFVPSLSHQKVVCSGIDITDKLDTRESLFSEIYLQELCRRYRPDPSQSKNVPETEIIK